MPDLTKNEACFYNREKRDLPHTFCAHALDLLDNKHKKISTNQHSMIFTNEMNENALF